MHYFPTIKRKVKNRTSAQFINITRYGQLKFRLEGELKIPQFIIQTSKTKGGARNSDSSDVKEQLGDLVHIMGMCLSQPEKVKNCFP